MMAEALSYTVQQSLPGNDPCLSNVGLAAITGEHALAHCPRGYEQVGVRGTPGLL